MNRPPENSEQTENNAQIARNLVYFIEGIGTDLVKCGPYIAKLADGTELELRTLVVDVQRSLNRHDAQGDPVYQVGTAQVIKARVPKKLKRRDAP